MSYTVTAANLLGHLYTKTNTTTYKTNSHYCQLGDLE